MLIMLKTYNENNWAIMFRSVKTEHPQYKQHTLRRRDEICKNIKVPPLSRHLHFRSWSMVKFGIVVLWNNEQLFHISLCSSTRSLGDMTMLRRTIFNIHFFCERLHVGFVVPLRLFSKTFCHQKSYIIHHFINHNIIYNLPLCLHNFSNNFPTFSSIY